MSCCGENWQRPLNRRQAGLLYATFVSGSDSRCWAPLRGTPLADNTSTWTRADTAVQYNYRSLIAGSARRLAPGDGFRRREGSGPPPPARLNFDRDVRICVHCYLNRFKFMVVVDKVTLYVVVPPGERNTHEKKRQWKSIPTAKLFGLSCLLQVCLSRKRESERNSSALHKQGAKARRTIARGLSTLRKICLKT